VNRAWINRWLSWPNSSWKSGYDRFSDRERRVLIRVAKRLHVTQDVNRAVEERQTFGDRLADRIARFGGSWAFIVIFLGVLIAWTGLNTAILKRFGEAFDPYPYIFLNLILSMLAAVQAPVILMSQNRQAKRDRLAAGLDYEINLKAEIEIMALHEKLDRIRVDHLGGISNAQQEQLRQLIELIDAKKAGAAQLSRQDSQSRQDAHELTLPCQAGELRPTGPVGDHTMLFRRRWCRSAACAATQRSLASKRMSTPTGRPARPGNSSWFLALRICSSKSAAAISETDATALRSIL
jgi:uncharacterized membrane protein